LSGVVVSMNYQSFRLESIAGDEESWTVLTRSQQKTELFLSSLQTTFQVRTFCYNFCLSVLLLVRF
jgi:hypothetical protein